MDNEKIRQDNLLLRNSIKRGVESKELEGKLRNLNTFENYEKEAYNDAAIFKN